MSLKSLVEIEEEDGTDDLLDFEEIKKYDPRQPRDPSGKWSDGAGGISVGHALHVAKHEGIGEEHHAAIESGIRSGKLDTREKVLGISDAIHGKQGTAAPSARVLRKLRMK